jgi:hypothetical protein
MVLAAADAELGSSGIKELPAGTLLWMPPELLDIAMLDNPLCLANDIFSFGMVRTCFTCV